MLAPVPDVIREPKLLINGEKEYLKVDWVDLANTSAHALNKN